MFIYTFCYSYGIEIGGKMTKQEIIEQFEKKEFVKEHKIPVKHMPIGGRPCYSDPFVNYLFSQLIESQNELDKELKVGLKNTSTLLTLSKEHKALQEKYDKLKEVVHTAEPMHKMLPILIKDDKGNEFLLEDFQQVLDLAMNTRPNDAKKMIETDLRKGLRIKVPDSDYGIVTGWEMQKHTANGVKPYLRIDYDVYRSKCVGHGSTNLSSIEVCKQSSVEIEGE